MKATGWIIAAVMAIAFSVAQYTIATKSRTVETLQEAVRVLERTCATYHLKLTGEPHPFYHEQIEQGNSYTKVNVSAGGGK